MELSEKLNRRGISLSENKCDKLIQYMDIVLERNEHINLTAITDRDEFIEKHIADSLSILGLEEYEEAASVVDVGTGAGFPGIPLAIASDKKAFTLLDATEKKLLVIEDAARKLGIENVEICHLRAEEAGKSHMREAFDLCVSRAVAEVRVLAELTLPLVRVGGTVVMYKGPDPSEEIDSAEEGIELLGGSISSLEEVEGEGRATTLLLVDKVAETPDKYPRSPGRPSKDPL